ncbi:hypothetical protein GF327_00890 [Candidatus Woesearchaeota archaeon]|nr:hypothetical protein [Candidatus Woesearchaeota archaeon]
MTIYLKKKLKEKKIKIDEPCYKITAGISKVNVNPNARLLLEKKYYEWYPFFWQKIAKSNSMKGAVIAELNNDNFNIYCKNEFDTIVEEIAFLNEKLCHKNPNFMKKSGSYYVLKKKIMKKIRNLQKSEAKKYINAIEYFKRLKILEDIITYPVLISEAYKTFKITKNLIKDINQCKQFIKENKNHLPEDKFKKIEITINKAINALFIDYKNPDFDSDIKFFLKSSNLNAGKYNLIYVDIKDAGIKIRAWHEKKILKYYNSNFDYIKFIKLNFYSYNEFLVLIRKVKTSIKKICEKYFSYNEVFLLGFGDEIFILMPEHKDTKKIIQEIKKEIKPDIRIVRTYFEIKGEINDFSTGRKVIDAFSAIKKGNKIIKRYEKHQERFNRIILIDPDYSYKLLDELGKF